MRYLFAVIVLAVAVFALAGCANSCGDSTTKNYQPTASVLLAAEPFYCTQLEKTFKDIDAEALVTSIVGGQFVFTPDADTPELPDYLPATITFGPLSSCKITVPDEEDDSWAIAHSDCEAPSMFSLKFTPVESEISELYYGSLGFYFKLSMTPPDDTACEVYALPDYFPQDGGVFTINCKEQHTSVDHLYPFIWHAPQ